MIELSAHGTTVHAAATHRLLERATSVEALADLVAVLDIALLADLPDVVQPVVARVEAQAAHDPDVVQVIDTLGPLARALRYGDVRGTDASALRTVFDGLVVRVARRRGDGLSLARRRCRGRDGRTAGRRAGRARRWSITRRAVLEWPAVLTVVAERSDVHGLVQGRATRLLHDGGTWNRALVGARLSRALSVGTTPAAGAAFVEGFLAGSGTVLVHDAELLDVIDGWVSSLAPDAFIADGALAAAHLRCVRTGRASSTRPAARSPGRSGMVGVRQRRRRPAGRCCAGHRAPPVGCTAMTEVRTR